MELRRRFDENARGYDMYRPHYAPELFDAIFAYSGAGPGARALEIGMGTGQATGPVLERGCTVTGVELGESLAAVARERFKDSAALDVVCADFMQCDLPGGFDLIYSATAFHWLPQDAALARVMAMLRPGGTLALFWNHPFIGRAGDETHRAVRAAYDKWLGDGRDLREFGEGRLPERVEQLERAGFEDVRARLFYGERWLSAEDYLGLMDTYSDHRALPDAVRGPLRRDIAAAIDATGGILTIYDTMDLYTARRPRVGG